MEQVTHQPVSIIWDYLQMHQTPTPADGILVLGSQDVRVAERGVALFLQGYAPLIIFSGGVGRLTGDDKSEAEADKFAQVAIRSGVPVDQMVVENKATNTGESVRYTKKLLAERGIDPKKIILVQTPYAERRAYATFQKQWPEKEYLVTSPRISLEEYPNEMVTEDEIINIMVGEVQRIKLYPAQEFQMPQDIPEGVWNAYQQLIAAGYTKYLLKE